MMKTNPSFDQPEPLMKVRHTNSLLAWTLGMAASTMMETKTPTATISEPI
jgi:hypothetical protein